MKHLARRLSAFISALILAAFAEDVAGAREIWVRDHLEEQALIHVSRTARMKSSGRRWVTVNSVIDVPAGARVVFVSLAAGVAESEPTRTEHYRDEVQIQMLTRESQPGCL